MAEEYSVIESDNMAELCEAVTQAMDGRWRCQGGVCVVWDPKMPPKPPAQAVGGFLYVQALTRRL
jgi:hypothetical protein